MGMIRRSNTIKLSGKTGLLKDQVYRQVIEMICNGQLTPDMIFTESQLIEQFGVSKSPVREALIQLCHEDVLKSLPRCGYQVIQVSPKNIHDITELRMFLELNSIPRTLEYMTEEKLQTLLKLNEKRVSESYESKSIWTAWNNNVEFHITLAACAGNAQVVKALKQAFSVMTRAYAQLYTTQKAIIAPNSECYHDRIVKALQNHDPYTAHEQLKQDIVYMEGSLLRSDMH